MYAGDGMGGQLVEFKFPNNTIYGKCDAYWSSEVGSKPAQRYRYTLATTKNERKIN